MNATSVWTPPRSALSTNFGSLLDRLVSNHGIAELDGNSFPAFLNAADTGVVLLTEEPDAAAESWDLAVLFPELLAATGTEQRAGLMRPAAARPVQQRFVIGRLPALLFVRDGGYVGVIEGLRDWAEFVAEYRTLLERPVSRAPGIGVAVTAAGTGGCQ